MTRHKSPLASYEKLPLVPYWPGDDDKATLIDSYMTKIGASEFNISEVAARQAVEINIGKRVEHATGIAEAQAGTDRETALATSVLLRIQQAATTMKPRERLDIFMANNALPSLEVLAQLRLGQSGILERSLALACFNILARSYGSYRSVEIEPTSRIRVDAIVEDEDSDHEHAIVTVKNIVGIVENYNESVALKSRQVGIVPLNPGMLSPAEMRALKILGRVGGKPGYGEERLAPSRAVALNLLTRDTSGLPTEQRTHPLLESLYVSRSPFDTDDN